MKNIIKGFSLLLFTSFLFTSCCKNNVPEIIEPPTPPRTFNYNVPSHDWENYTADWIDLYQALSSNGFGYEVLCHGNTSSAYADFNFDGSQDIMVYSNLADGDDVNKHFLTYDKNTENFNISVVFNKTESTIDYLSQLALFMNRLIRNLNLKKPLSGISARQRATPNLPDHRSFD